MGEEVTCVLPGGRELHLGVFDFQERQHHEIACRRHDAEALFAYLAEQRLPVVAAGFIASATVTVLKGRFRRPRPCDMVAHPVFRVSAPDRFSFPSGHTINAFAICGVLALEWPVLTPVLGLLAGGIGASRVILGLHYASDVAAGALLGIVIAAGVGALLLP